METGPGHTPRHHLRLNTATVHPAQAEGASAQTRPPTQTQKPRADITMPVCLSPSTGRSVSPWELCARLWQRSWVWLCPGVSDTQEVQLANTPPAGDAGHTEMPRHRASPVPGRLRAPRALHTQSSAGQAADSGTHVCNEPSGTARPGNTLTAWDPETEAWGTLWGPQAVVWPLKPT